MESAPPTPGTTSPPTSTLALVSLVSGIASWIVLPAIGAVVAVITGHMARREIRANPGRFSGDGLAMAGLILGYVQIGIIVLSVCCAVLIFAATGVSFLEIFSQGLPSG
ncbi:MAG: hypothetical protein A2Z17_02490 [Gammaproteobacteria bacterium RBG_16_66_13]|nr:MAG: hypothetical protein A2Z17_02490 [Gammaproteobacteria bacterium RBG_16_66_13]